jgi:thiol-disulfide isomerase/thioredoxin
MVPAHSDRPSAGKEKRMIRPLFAVGQVLLAALFTMPGCGKNERREVPFLGVTVGQVAPDVSGIDLEGAPLKLGDHRGKIVSLSFWASWCPPCRSMFPHERELVEKFKDRPFVLVGVNGDDFREQGLDCQQKHQLNWKSLWNGGRDGAITSLYGIQGWPTVYLIDAKGVVRRRFEGVMPQTPHMIEQAIEGMVRELEEQKGHADATPANGPKAAPVVRR